MHVQWVNNEDYLPYMVKYICEGVFSNSIHGERFSTACLSISKNTGWSINLAIHEWNKRMRMKYGRKKKEIKLVLTIDATDNRKSNFLGSFFVHLLSWATTAENSVYKQNHCHKWERMKIKLKWKGVSKRVTKVV